MYQRNGFRFYTTTRNSVGILSLGNEMLLLKCNINILEVPHLVKSRKWLSPVKDLGLFPVMGMKMFPVLKCVSGCKRSQCAPYTLSHALKMFTSLAILSAGLCRYPTSLHMISVWVFETQAYLRLLWFSFCVCREHKSGDTSICGELVHVDYVCACHFQLKNFFNQMNAKKKEQMCTHRCAFILNHSEQNTGAKEQLHQIKRSEIKCETLDCCGTYVFVHACALGYKGVELGEVNAKKKRREKKLNILNQNMRKTRPVVQAVFLISGFVTHLKLEYVLHVVIPRYMQDETNSYVSVQR